ncbi:hypothetical protein GCM10011575_13340 [Microlunatus endophyticus]|uniref:Uncharacterized protein n=1 Tax=Microlunatus endophyticus TaxID=1716077 RepID=A0A917S674_9ACTN|nr:hypothetical protein GCM10011575_13340 [Microlunatus endophyticus]
MGVTALATVLILVLGACSHASPTGDHKPAPGSDTGLKSALARISDTAANRNGVYYDDTAGLTKLTGDSPAEGFGPLLGFGASSLSSMGKPLRDDTGIDVAGESYAISAGQPPRALTVVAGGQDGRQVTSRLTKLGWKSAAGALTAPSVTATYGIQLAKVRPDGSDVIIGGTGADLDRAGDPDGATLADDALTSALAGCLGDVVTAYFVSGSTVTSSGMTELAAGIARPASASATPRAVVCTAWSSPGTASRYAAAARTDLKSGTSDASNRPYSSLLKNSGVTSVGGRQNVVRWQADTPGNASMIFTMVVQRDLPGLE